MNIQRISANPRLAGAVVHGGLAWLSGQVPDDRTQNCRGQTEQVLAKIDALLAQAGTNKSRLLSAQIWLKDIEADFAAMNEAWSQWLPESAAPARATVQARLASPDVLVEIMLVAAI
ncbi:RidA family protein [Pseudomonas typographi]|uniref:RidA family protein n=1 Tax=Pseudomonas typographi TaxID=2715964 RepID=UPI0016845F7F|nr:RidA family protein [Pseudomonas typographi]MBD1551370.1 RidA family protein [Pseudomonas typographi]